MEPAPTADDAVVHNAEDRSRYELELDGQIIGIADYRDDGERIVIPHTEITPHRRGQGWGDVLVAGVLDDIRDRGRTVVPACWFVAAFIEQHADYADLTVTPHP